jgi:hypothetical protein
MATPEGASMNAVLDYSFTAYAGVSNCCYCDLFTHVNEWATLDGALLVCQQCEITKRFGEY